MSEVAAIWSHEDGDALETVHGGPLDGGGFVFYGGLLGLAQGGVIATHYRLELDSELSAVSLEWSSRSSTNENRFALARSGDRWHFAPDRELHINTRGTTSIMFETLAFPHTVIMRRCAKVGEFDGDALYVTLLRGASSAVPFRYRRLTQSEWLVQMGDEASQRLTVDERLFVTAAEGLERVAFRIH